MNHVVVDNKDWVECGQIQLLPDRRKIEQE